MRKLKLEHGITVKWAPFFIAGLTFIGTYLVSNLPSITNWALSLVSSVISGGLTEALQRSRIESIERNKRIHTHVDPQLTNVLKTLSEIPSCISRLIVHRRALSKNRPVDGDVQSAYNELICTSLRRADTQLAILEDEGGFDELDVLCDGASKEINRFREASVDYMAINILFQTTDKTLQAFSEDVERTRSLLSKLKLVG